MNAFVPSHHKSLFSRKTEKLLTIYKNSYNYQLLKMHLETCVHKVCPWDSSVTCAGARILYPRFGKLSLIPKQKIPYPVIVLHSIREVVFLLLFVVELK